MTITWITKGFDGLDLLGYLPSFISDKDPRPAREQFDANYAFGGWQPFEGFKMDKNRCLTYPGDPKLCPIAYAKLRDEEIFAYPSSWVAIVQPDGSFEVARLD